MNYKFGVLLCSFLLAGFSCVAQVALSPAGSQFDCSTLVAGRTYANAFDGYINTELFPVPGFSGDHPNAGIGTLTFHTDGTVTGVYWLKVGPAYLGANSMVNASYRLTWDAGKRPLVCAGTMRMDLPLSPTGSENWQIIVRDRGGRIELIHTDQGLTVAYEASLLYNGKCSNTTLNATYTYTTTAWTMSPPTMPAPLPTEMLNGFVPLAFSGAIHFIPYIRGAGPNPPPGSAYLEGWDMTSLNGYTAPRKYVGWYIVNSDCSATMVLSDNIGNPIINTQALVLAGAQKILIMNTDVPFALAFTAKREP